MLEFSGKSEVRHDDLERFARNWTTTITTGDYICRRFGPQTASIRICTRNTGERLKSELQHREEFEGTSNHVNFSNAR